MKKGFYLVLLLPFAFIFFSGCLDQPQGAAGGLDFSSEGGGTGKCSCGCGLELGVCKMEHPTCPVSNPE